MKTKYEDTLFYEINLSAKYLNLLFEQLFKELNFELSGVENLALKIIIETKDCCQRDLARLILKDRANVGKLANNLQKKGLINIELKTKNNRMVKILTATKKGIEISNKVQNTLMPIIEKIYNAVSGEMMEDTITNLKNFRKIVEKTVKVNI